MALVIFEKRDSILCVSLNRPSALNAINSKLLEDLESGIKEHINDKTIKEGRLYYQRHKEKIRFRITFEETLYDGRRFKEPEHFLFMDGWLTHRQERSKREDRYEVTRPGQPSGWR